ncbi:hypothetical protein Tsubulata_032567 [Turnera subulata]|uniref:histidine kinase n=1 Tax=Turnera subulata TaxID=218843 RepID=A0A9Q0JAY8_9ROSI|nr:hypothetical protein Tsubulata_032567 [Turnera subulata]
MQAFVVLVVPTMVIPTWVKMTKHMKREVYEATFHFQDEVLCRINNISTFFDPLSSAATNLVRLLSSSMAGSDTSKSSTRMKVDPVLFQTFSVLPLISQISYIGFEGHFISYYDEGNQTFALYSSSTNSSNSGTTDVKENSTWYKQPVDYTGRLHGLAVEHYPMVKANESWIQGATDNPDGSATLGYGWNNAEDLLFLNTVRIQGKGVISLGYPVKALVNYLSSIQLHGGKLYLATLDGVQLMEAFPNTEMLPGGDSVSFDLINPSNGGKDRIAYAWCRPDSTWHKKPILTIGKKRYTVDCAPLEILGVKLVYALVFPFDEVVSKVRWMTVISLLLLTLILFIMVFSIFIFVVFMINSARREVQFCSSLIKQKEATQQAERKSMNKSLAFARSSHDIRAALAGISGLIELSYEEVSPGSELDINLRQMDGCAKDLLGLLNSILDTSKMEAGKLQLEEEEFNVANLLEDVVDLFHPVGMKKDVEVILDSYDGSFLKHSLVKGDRAKLKQVICNLLSNAVKFTSEGHVSVRAWAQNSAFEDKITESRRNSLWKDFPCLIYKNKEEYDDLETVNAVRNDPNSMEFVFEVDDTGKGIPKEKQESVFENFVQVKETALGQGGTGLGLGIVQSLVRLMGGDIRIVDKPNGERGTCLRFSVLLIASGTPTNDDIEANNTDNNTDMGCYCLSDYQRLALSRRIPSPGLTSPQLSLRSSSPKTEGSLVVLFIHNVERRRACHSFMEHLGIKVSAVKKWEHLRSTLMKINSTLSISPQGSRKNDLGSRSDNYSSRSKDLPLSSMDGTTQRTHSHTSIANRIIPSFVLLVIDVSAGAFQEIYKIVEEFRRQLHGTRCQVVWLDKPMSRNIQVDKIDPCDEIFLKPFHGSRLYHVIGLLPEFSGSVFPQGAPPRPKRESTVDANNTARDIESSSEEQQSYGRTKQKSAPPYGRHSLQGMDQQAETRTKRENYMKRYPSANQERSAVVFKPATSTETEPIRISEIQEASVNRNSDKPLSGLKFLVAEDVVPARRIAMKHLEILGATAEVCGNGQEALAAVRKGLEDQRIYDGPVVPPYDYILMDCEVQKDYN